MRRRWQCASMRMRQQCASMSDDRWRGQVWSRPRGPGAGALRRAVHVWCCVLRCCGEDHHRVLHVVSECKRESHVIYTKAAIEKNDATFN